MGRTVVRLRKLIYNDFNESGWDNDENDDESDNQDRADNEQVNDESYK